MLSKTNLEELDISNNNITGALPAEDQRQIKRWKAIKRHVSQIQKNCRTGDLDCRKKQRQALLHWAYDSTRL